MDNLLLTGCLLGVFVLEARWQTLESLEKHLLLEFYQVGVPGDGGGCRAPRGTV